jgi:beta-RFAP synthase
MKAGLRSVTIRAPARLHLGFLDLNGSRGRRFGSVGLALEDLGVLLTAARSAAFSVTGPQAGRVEAFARRIQQKFQLPADSSIAVLEAIPEHVGLGSGTQLAIAAGVALTRLYKLELSVREVAALHERGQRSGIGVGAFEQGGFLVDGGKGPREDPPPLVARAEFPEDWRVLLIFDNTIQGLHGEDEAAAFRSLPEFPESVSAQMCRLVLMQALPALHERDLEGFSRAIAELQRVIGDYFAPVQGGRRFTSPNVAEVLAWLEHEGVVCVGQSSWGPTGFAILGNEAQARRLARIGESRWGPGGALRFMVFSARNRGGDVEVAHTVRTSAGANRS